MIAEFGEMVFNTLMDWIYRVVQLCFSWINIPNFPVELRNSLDTFLNLIFDNLGLLGFFIRPLTIKIAVPILIVVINFELIYKLIMWIVRKLPFVAIR